MRRGAGLIAGVDEVGRGPLAGPVVACAVILFAIPPGLADSKTLSAAQRAALVPSIRACGLIGVGAASVAEIDRLNVRGASLLAMRRAVARLPLQPAWILVDGTEVPDLDVPAEAVIDGDALVPEIMAASIVAKQLRDEAMRRLDRRYPGYGFAQHAGYPTPAHREALSRLGPTPHHRRSFRPVRTVLAALKA